MADAATHRLWRVFPWDASAKVGEAFSVRSVAPRTLQGGGRFDLPELTSVLYLGTSAAHGYAELFRRWPTIRLREDHLYSANGHRLACVPVDLPLDFHRDLPDLADGATLDRYGIRADTLALPPTRRAETQAVARTLWDDGRAGFRWWSAFHGKWHSTVLFVERVPADALSFGTPRYAAVDDPDVIAGARAANMIV